MFTHLLGCRAWRQCCWCDAIRQDVETAELDGRKCCFLSDRNLKAWVDQNNPYEWDVLWKYWTSNYYVVSFYKKIVNNAFYCGILRILFPKLPTRNYFTFLKSDWTLKMSWPSGLVHWTQVLVLSKCGFKSRPWPVAALVSSWALLSETLNHNCFVLRMGRKAAGPVCCVMHVKEPRTLVVKEKGLATAFLDLRLEHPAGWICARYKSSVLLLLYGHHHQFYTSFTNNFFVYIILYYWSHTSPPRTSKSIQAVKTTPFDLHTETIQLFNYSKQPIISMGLFSYVLSSGTR